MSLFTAPTVADNYIQKELDSQKSQNLNNQSAENLNKVTPNLFTSHVCKII